MPPNEPLNEHVLASLYFDYIQAGVFITRERCKQDLRNWHPNPQSIALIQSALEATPIEARQGKEQFLRYISENIINKFS